MNYLQIGQRLAKEADISGASNGTLPATMAGQAGEMLSVVQWVNDAYEQIQNLNNGNWLFLRFDFTFNTTNAKSNYTSSDAGLSEFDDWKNETTDDRLRTYLTTDGNTKEQWMTFVPWEKFRVTYGFGANRATTGRPIFYTFKPDKSVTFYPIPDDTYTIVGEYFKRAQLMVADADAPLFPRYYHMTIVWYALMNYAGFNTASATYAHAKNRYDELMNGLQGDQLAAIGIAGSLI